MSTAASTAPAEPAAPAAPLEIVQEGTIHLGTGGAGTFVEVDVCIFASPSGY